MREYTFFLVPAASAQIHAKKILILRCKIFDFFFFVFFIFNIREFLCIYVLSLVPVS
jgi:hypothetical protein